MAKPHGSGLRTANLAKPFPVGVTVACRTEEEPIPHLAVIKAAHTGKGEPTYTVLWLYRSVDCRGKLPEIICMPCTIERHLPGESGMRLVVDPGNLKEVFFSGHSDMIPHSSILHEVHTWYVPNAGAHLPTEQLKDIVFQPGFICRYIVDPQDWTYYPLKPSTLANVGDAQLLKGLIKRTEADCRKVWAASGAGP